LLLLFRCETAHCLTLKIGDLRLEFDYPLHCVVPALFERAGNQAIAGVGLLIAAFCQVGIVAGPLDPSAPLRKNRFVARFQVGQCFECKFDCQWRNGGQQTRSNGVIQRLCRNRHAVAKRRCVPTSRVAVIARVKTAVAGIASTQTPPARRVAEAKAADDARRVAEAKAAEEARRVAEAKAAEDARHAAEAKAAEEARHAAEAKAAEDARRAAEVKAAEDARRAAEAKAAEDARRVAKASNFRPRERERVMLDLVVTYWIWLISALIAGGPAGYWLIARASAEEARRAAEVKAAEEARGFARILPRAIGRIGLLMSTRVKMLAIGTMSRMKLKLSFCFESWAHRKVD
jgi:flagellar biosynthesis GTPase FlhF